MSETGKEWSVHEVANCMECKWESEARDAKHRAKRHHDETGHRVIGERGLAFSFGAPPRKENEP